MGFDKSFNGTSSRLVPQMKGGLSGWHARETAASTALIKFRDSIRLPGATAYSAVDGAAGNVTAGLHYIAQTWVTQWGESAITSFTFSPWAEFTAAGSKHATVTIPTAPVNAQAGVVLRDTVVGRRIYVTKAGAPATGLEPTNAQLFLIMADASTTLSAGMNNLYLPRIGGSITVASTTGFAASGNILVTTNQGAEPVAYTSVDATHFLGCTGGVGLMATGNAVTQPMVGDNTSTTYDWNTADGSLTATNPPVKDTCGRIIDEASLAASETAGDAFGGQLQDMENDGGVYVEMTSGAISWGVRGR